MKRIAHFMLATCVLLTLGGCGQSLTQLEQTVNGIANVVVHDTYSRKAVIKDVIDWVRENKITIGIGVVRPEDIDIYPLDRPQIIEFRLSEEKEFNPYFFTYNDLVEPSTVLVTAFLDYKQINSTLDGKTGLLHQLTVPAGKEVNLPFSMDIEGNGAHDVQIVIFRDPYNKTKDVNYRMSLDSRALGFRTVVVVGDDETPVRTLEPGITGVPIPPDAKVKREVLFVSLPGEGLRPSDRQLYVADSTAGGTYSFQIYNANSGKSRSVVQAMIPFLDYHQISLNGSDLLVASLNPGEEALTDIELPLAAEPDIHQLQIIYLFDPYKSILRHEVYYGVVLGSFRIAIDAK